MDSDGSPEIVVGRTIYNSDGSLCGKGRFGVGRSVYAARPSRPTSTVTVSRR